MTVLGGVGGIVLLVFVISYFLLPVNGTCTLYLYVLLSSTCEWYVHIVFTCTASFYL